MEVGRGCREGPRGRSRERVAAHGEDGIEARKIFGSDVYESLDLGGGGGERDRTPRYVERE